jgi:hypothetical protein
VVEGEEFLSLPVSQIIQIIKSDKLIVPAEEEVRFARFWEANVELSVLANFFICRYSSAL